MSLLFMPASLGFWDDMLEEDAPSKALALTFFSDERPLHGVAGLVDWRLCGRLSRLITTGYCSGKLGDSVMMPAGRRVPFDKLFLFGLGKGERMDDALFSRHVKWISEVLKRAGVKSYALQAPGRATGLIGARQAAELWIQNTNTGDASVTLLDSVTAQKEIGDLLAAS